MSAFDIIQSILMLITAIFTGLAWRELHTIRKRQEVHVEYHRTKDHYI
jgi:hypothetical protein